MNKAQTTEVLSILAVEYRNEVIDEDRISIWHAILADEDYAKIRGAVVAWLKDPQESRFFPKPAALIALSHRGEQTRDDAQVVSRYFDLVTKYQNQTITEAERGALRSLELALNVHASARMFVQFPPYSSLDSSQLRVREIAEVSS